MKCPECGRTCKNKRTKQLIKENGKCGMCLRGTPNPLNTKRYSRLNSLNRGSLLQ